MVRWEWITPFGSRVVPEVNATIDGASGSTGRGPASGSAPSASSNGMAPEGSSPAGVSPTTSQVAVGSSPSSPA